MDILKWWVFLLWLLKMLLLLLLISSYLFRPTVSSGPKSRTVLTWRSRARPQLLGKDGSHRLVPALRGLNSLPDPAKFDGLYEHHPSYDRFNWAVYLSWRSNEPKGPAFTYKRGAARRMAKLHKRPNYQSARLQKRGHNYKSPKKISCCSSWLWGGFLAWHEMETI